MNRIWEITGYDGEVVTVVAGNREDAISFAGDYLELDCDDLEDLEGCAVKDVTGERQDHQDRIRWVVFDSEEDMEDKIKTLEKHGADSSRVWRRVTCAAHGWSPTYEVGAEDDQWCRLPGGPLHVIY